LVEESHPNAYISPTGQLDTPIGGCPCLSVCMGR
jgi:hypothetical protein